MQLDLYNAIGSTSSRPNKEKEIGQRAKRALKREAADKAAAKKNQQPS